MLPDHPNDGERAAQFVTITKSDSSILVVNTHLTHLNKRSGLRMEQIETILSHAALRQNHDLILLCGDFNARPESYEIQHVMTHPEIPMIDVLAKCYKSEQLATYPVPSLEQNSQSSSKRIDYIFAFSTTKSLENRQIKSGLALNHPSEDGLYPSDHFGIWADISI
jgi:endonuclease/exonuclease/phosphatase family metal-dependent hydrolase